MTAEKAYQLSVTSQRERLLEAIKKAAEDGRIRCPAPSELFPENYKYFINNDYVFRDSGNSIRAYITWGE